MNNMRLSRRAVRAPILSYSPGAPARSGRLGEIKPTTDIIQPGKPTQTTLNQIESPLNRSCQAFWPSKGTRLYTPGQFLRPLPNIKRILVCAVHEVRTGQLFE